MATRRARGLGAGFGFRLAFQLIPDAGATGGGQDSEVIAACRSPGVPSRLVSSWS